MACVPWCCAMKSFTACGSRYSPASRSPSTTWLRTTAALIAGFTPSEIAEAIVAAGGPQVDKRRIEVRSPIRSVGEHPVHVRLHDEVAADVTINVVAS